MASKVDNAIRGVEKALLVLAEQDEKHEERRDAAVATYTQLARRRGPGSALAHGVAGAALAEVVQDTVREQRRNEDRRTQYLDALNYLIKKNNETTEKTIDSF